MTAPPPTLGEITSVFARIGLLSFGGPAAQIALMHRELVERRGWVAEGEYLSALSFCMLLPGPEAMQLATWTGWRLRGTAGGLIAGLLFVAPGAVVVLALAALYAALGQVPLVAALFTGVQAAVIAIVIEALLRVSRRALRGPGLVAVAICAFAALFLFALPYPLLILLAALWGAFFARGASQPASALPGPAPWRESLVAALAWGVVWLVPLALLLWQGGLMAELALFFSKLALLTFGGAYAVLAWMAQEVVESRGWLSAAQMMDGLGLAETTPGPLILVTEFVGYVAAHRAGGPALGLVGAAVAVWMTFAPCFLWIFAFGPWMQRLTASPRLAGALAGIMAAVVGVIGHLALWFALHVLFSDLTQVRAFPFILTLPDPTSLRPLTLALALLCAYLLLRRHWPLIGVLGLAATTSALGGLFPG